MGTTGATLSAHAPGSPGCAPEAGYAPQLTVFYGEHSKSGPGNNTQ